MTVTIKKIGGSVGVVIPKAVAQQMELTEGTPLEISNTPAGLLMRKQGRRPRRRLSQIVRQMNSASYRRHTRELDDRPVGREAW